MALSSHPIFIICNNCLIYRSTQVKTYSWSNAQVILVGNKCNMEEDRVVSYERGKQFADQLGLEFFETSAKDNVNVEQVFERMADIICDRMSRDLVINGSGD